MEIEPNCIYVIPPRKNLTVTENRLTIREKDVLDKGPNTSIDTFFYSLAHSYGDKAIAIVLSGTGTDGSRGIEAIKDSDGLVIVQDPETSKFDGMPRSSIATGRVDLVLHTKDMHSEIINYINEIPNVNLIEKSINEETLNKVLHVLHKQTGCDFQQYKPPTILRRLTRRLAFLKLASAEEYLQTAEKELKDTELRLELALNAADMAGWHLDVKTDSLVFTGNLPEIFGHSKETLLSANDMRSQYLVEDKHIYQDAWKKAADTGIYEYVIRMRRPDNNIRWIKTTGVALRDEKGDIAKMIGITRDITFEKMASLELENKVAERTTELRNANEKLKRSNSQLARSNDDLEQFAYIASHDLQEPLRKIQTFISVLESKRNDEKALDNYLGKISSSANRMSSLIKNVLEFSRLNQKEEAMGVVNLKQPWQFNGPALKYIIAVKFSVCTLRK
ncbi:PAS domain S-box protein, partial [Ostertagia ostertagi]